MLFANRLALPIKSRGSIGLICFSCISLFAAEEITATPAEEIMHIAIEPATTVVKEKILFATINAKVTLTISKLMLVGSKITGFYETKIDTTNTPILFRSAARKKAEIGYLELLTKSSIPELKSSGGVFEGKGYCIHKKQPERDILCKLTPDEKKPLQGVATLTINSGNHILNFTSRYRVLTDAAEIKRATAKVAYKE